MKVGVGVRVKRITFILSVHPFQKSNKSERVSQKKRTSISPISCLFLIRLTLSLPVLNLG